MTQLRTVAAFALLSAGLAGPAVAQSAHSHGGHRTSGDASATHDHDMATMIQAMKPNPKDPPSTRDFKAADMTMMRDMHVPYTGDADVDFRTHMIPHHRGAVAMAKVALTYAKDPATKAMAQKIIDDQETEIAEMEAWLKQHGK